MGDHRGLSALLLLTVLASPVSGSVPEPLPAGWVDAARAVPVAAEGRVLPLDTWAPVVYSRLSGRDRDPAALGWFLTLLCFPERLADQAFLLVNDPEALAGTGVDVPGRGRYSPRTLAALFPLARDWTVAYADDPGAAGKERVRLGRALVLYQTLAATFDLGSAQAAESPFLVLTLGKDPANPARTLATDLPPPDRDRLALLLFWHQASVSPDGRWEEAAQALRLFAGSAAALEVVHNTVPWAGLAAALAGLGLVLTWFLRRSSPWEAVVPALAWTVVTVWLGVRMAISGRPPVTNLASTFLLVSWLALGLAAVLTLRRAPKITRVLALAAGALLPLASGLFEAGSDPFSPLQAVLNTNLWLSVHVTVIVAGYACTLGAGLVGHAYLGASTARKGGGDLLALWKALRASLVLGLALTLTGTLLGGFWADQSWGRFWGWDPKENGALLIVLWLALTLHLKPSGLTQEWGTALAAALALPVLLFSWLGVNLLGVGFHSYGAAPDKALLFLGLLALDLGVLAVLILRRVLR